MKQCHEGDTVKVTSVLFSALVAAAVLIGCQGEPSYQAVVRVEILPGHMQRYSTQPEQISLTLEGDIADTRPVLDVLTSAEWVDLASSSRQGLTPIATPRDETYRGAEVQWFAFPAVPSGEYEIAIRLADWGVIVVPQASAIEDAGAWVSRFRID